VPTIVGGDAAGSFGLWRSVCRVLAVAVGLSMIFSLSVIFSLVERGLL
jgi:hypothetical protein